MKRSFLYHPRLMTGRCHSSKESPCTPGPPTAQTQTKAQTLKKCTGSQIIRKTGYAMRLYQYCGMEELLLLRSSSCIYFLLVCVLMVRFLYMVTGARRCSVSGSSDGSGVHVTKSDRSLALSFSSLQPAPVAQLFVRTIISIDLPNHKHFLNPP